MSKIKSPSEKKALSLDLDRRNTYGENAKASRKNIPRGKQRSHQHERRAVGQILGGVQSGPDPDDVFAAEGAAKAAAQAKKLRAFKKEPDTPLGVVVERKLQEEERLVFPPSCRYADVSAGCALRRSEISCPRCAVEKVHALGVDPQRDRVA